jgi:hypothetical protein
VRTHPPSRRDGYVIDELLEQLLGKIAKAELRERAATLHADATT